MSYSLVEPTYTESKHTTHSTCLDIDPQGLGKTVKLDEASDS